MWGYGNSARIEAIGNYAEAKERFDNTIPIRGNEGCHPLGRNRRYTQFEIEKNMRAVHSEDNPLGVWEQTYSATCYRKELVEWRPNGEVLLSVGRWGGVTEMATINYVLRDKGIELESVNGKLYVNTKTGAYYLGREEGRTLQMQPQPQSPQVNVGWLTYTPKNPVQEYKYSANRKALNQVKRRYKPFIEYMSNMLAIDGHLAPHPDKWDRNAYTLLAFQHWARAEATLNRKKFFNTLDGFVKDNGADLELAYNLANYFGHCMSRYSSHYDKAQFLRDFYTILKVQFADEVFTATPVPIGTAFYDPNAKYVK